MTVDQVVRKVVIVVCTVHLVVERVGGDLDWSIAMCSQHSVRQSECLSTDMAEFEKPSEGKLEKSKMNSFVVMEKVKWKVSLTSY
jgi:hypothetical protein